MRGALSVVQIIWRIALLQSANPGIRLGDVNGSARRRALTPHRTPHFRTMCRDGTPWALPLSGTELPQRVDGGQAVLVCIRPLRPQPIDVNWPFIVAVVILTAESQALGEEGRRKKRRDLVEIVTFHVEQ